MRVVFIATTDQQTENYYSTIHALDLIYSIYNLSEVLFEYDVTSAVVFTKMRAKKVTNGKVSRKCGESVFFFFFLF